MGFQRREDRELEEEVGRVLSRAWDCEMKGFGENHTADFFGVRGGRVELVAELKCRKHSSTQFPTVFLSMRKWIALQLHAVGMGIPAYFVVRFTDCIKYIRVNDRVWPLRIAGRNVMRQDIDQEPCYEVPVSEMLTVDDVSRYIDFEEGA